MEDRTLARSKAVAKPSAGHLEERVRPDECAENDPHRHLVEAKLFHDERCGVGQAHAVQVRNEVHQAEEKQHDPTHMASPGLFQLLHSYSSTIPRITGRPEFEFRRFLPASGLEVKARAYHLNVVAQIYTAPPPAAIFFRYPPLAMRVRARQNTVLHLPNL